VRTVSLDDWTGGSREFMASHGTTAYSSEDHLKEKKDVILRKQDASYRWAQEAALY